MTKNQMYYFFPEHDVEFSRNKLSLVELSLGLVLGLELNLGCTYRNSLSFNVNVALATLEQWQSAIKTNED